MVAVAELTVPETGSQVGGYFLAESKARLAAELVVKDPNKDSLKAAVLCIDQ